MSYSMWKMRDADESGRVLGRSVRNAGYYTLAEALADAPQHGPGDYIVDDAAGERAARVRIDPTTTAEGMPVTEAALAGRAAA